MWNSVCGECVDKVYVVSVWNSVCGECVCGECVDTVYVVSVCIQCMW